MKKIFLIFCVFLSCNKKNIMWNEQSFDNILKNINNKIIMVDFYADW